MYRQKLKHEKNKHKNCTLLIQNFEGLALHFRNQIITVRIFLTYSYFAELSFIGKVKRIDT